jgi:hypothetical protein
MGKHCTNSQCLKKNNKAKFLIGSILKKINRDNFRKKKTKQTPKKGGKIMLETL